MNWTLSGKLSIRYDYDEMVFRFYEKPPLDLPEHEAQTLLSIAHGDQEFQSFYDFLVKIVPSMERKGDLGKKHKSDCLVRSRIASILGN